MAHERPIIDARALRKSFGTTEVVRSIDLAIAAGSCFGILGPNGAGKTTTLRMVLGQSPLSGGTLNVFGLPMPASGRHVRARTGVVPQIDNLDPDFTVGENLRIYGNYFGLNAAVLKRRIGALLNFVNLSDRADTKIATLSGGMRRRLTIARALINDPELVILDEPTTGLDPQIRHLIWGRLRDLRDQGKTLLLTTHYMEEAERLCDALVVMDHGRILDQGTPRELIRRHVEPEVIEVRDNGKAAQHLLPADGGRTEIVGDSIYYYTSNARAAIARLEAQPNLTFYHRPANLEDVFMKLTGRELRE
ncbi:MAG: ATP-binding cassette domain-containing protein [Gammaproteobacteria bacterium]|nr:ATP-binding cassette domain-containing protein [Gammaproteobacteria bacterium]